MNEKTLKEVMDLINNVHKQSMRLSATPVVDDDFPEVKFEFDRAVLAYAEHLRGYKR